MYLSRREVRRAWGLVPRIKEIIGTRVAFTIKTRSGAARVCADSRHGSDSQTVHLSILWWPRMESDQWIIDRIRDAALACHPSVTAVGASSNCSFATQVAIGNLRFKDAFAPAWAVALKKAGLDPQDCYVGPYDSSGKTTGESLQKWLNEIPVAP